MTETRRVEISLRKQAKIRGKIRKIYQEERNLVNEARLNALYSKLETLEQETADARCKRCGRSLTNEQSLIHGYGAICFKQLFGAIPWVDFVDLVEETKFITKRNIPASYSEGNIADSLSRVEIEMIETKIRTLISTGTDPSFPPKMTHPRSRLPTHRRTAPVGQDSSKPPKTHQKPQRERGVK